MSELPAGSVSLEDDAPTISTQPAASAPPAADPPPSDPPADDPEGTIEGSGGVKFVPLNAVVELRGKVRESKTALEAKDAEIAALRDKATKFDQVSGEWQAAQPLIQALKNGTYQPRTASAPQVNQAAIDTAKDLDLYTADGKPDVERAQKILDRQTALAREQAQQLVQPLYQNTAQSQSAANFEQAANFKDKSGFQVDRATLQTIWNQVPPELSMRPEVASILWRQAVAETVLQGKFRPGVAPPPPVQHTESLGGGAPTRAEMSAAERNFASAVGMKTGEFEKISANFKPGERNALE